MKKILALVSFLIIATACANQPATTNTNSNTNTTTAKSPAPTEAEMIAKEKGAWDTLKKKDYDGFGNLLTSDYVEITDAGVFDKPALMTSVKDFNITDTSFSDWKMLPVNDDAVIITYQATIKGTFKGGEVPPGPYRSAAAWVNRDGKWLAIFYQQTLIKAMPPPPPAAAKSEKTPATATATAPAKPGEAGPDPITDEKLVWDYFRSKNYEGFASLLDPAFVELESYAVFDKAGAVKSVGEFDADTMELSDWKSVKLNNNAALVTYLVKPKDPKFAPENHTSIWANRGGKWVAMLHMGTPILRPPAKKN